MTTPARDGRPSGEQGPEIRSEYQRDLDRVIYDYYFRRLAAITQVSSGGGKILRHNRMTHSLKVAQVGRRLVQYLRTDEENELRIAELGGIDEDVVDAAGLLHDIGHPPFGHIAEKELDRIARKEGLPDGFEGNAQTLRIILSLTTHRSREKGMASAGLDLTHAVTAACVKYPWGSEAGRSKWAYYEPEKDHFERYVEPLLPRPGVPTLEAEIMDWADDITYAVHDLQDFFVDGLIPLHRLRHTGNGDDNGSQSHEMTEFWDYAVEKLRRREREMPDPRAIRRRFKDYSAKFPEDPYRGGFLERAALGGLASDIITDASKATSITRNGRLYVHPTMRAVIEIMKQITWFYVIDRPALVSVQIGQEVKIRELFDQLFGWVKRGYGDPPATDAAEQQWVHKLPLPFELVENIETLLQGNRGDRAYQDPRLSLVRGTIDYIASMTEAEFDDLYLRLTCGSHLPAMVSDRLA